MKRIVAVLAVVLCAAGATGCATERSAAGSKVLDADERTVAGCAYLGDVHGSAESVFAPATGMKNARNEAAEEAAKKGATHVVWTAAGGGKSQFVDGRAYKCAVVGTQR